MEYEVMPNSVRCADLLCFTELSVFLGRIQLIHTGRLELRNVDNKKNISTSEGRTTWIIETVP
jgi:hypothetical protein